MWFGLGGGEILQLGKLLMKHLELLIAKNQYEEFIGEPSGMFQMLFFFYQCERLGKQAPSEPVNGTSCSNEVMACQPICPQKMGRGTSEVDLSQKRSLIIPDAHSFGTVILNLPGKC